MSGEKKLAKLLGEMQAKLNDGHYVFATVKNINNIDRADTLCEFKENEGVTVVMAQTRADELKLEYHYVAAWITLMVHSSLEAVGLTAKFSTALAKHNISCNVIAGYYHDHIFVDKNDAAMAMEVLVQLSKER